MKNSKRNREKKERVLGSPETPCYFSSALDETLTCSFDGRFDDNGLPVRDCKWYPCKKIIQARKDMLKKERGAKNGRESINKQGDDRQDQSSS